MLINFMQVFSQTVSFSALRLLLHVHSSEDCYSRTVCGTECINFSNAFSFIRLSYHGYTIISLEITVNAFFRDYRLSSELSSLILL